jgi:hypothetical protein
MAYNMNYTTLPTFTPQSIGYIAANQNYTTSGPGGNVFTVSVTPGVYLFTSCVGYTIPGAANDSQLLSFNLTNVTNSNAIICLYNNITYNSLVSSQLLCGTLSHVFSLNSTSTLTFNITYPPYNPNALSYSLVRIA